MSSYLLQILATVTVAGITSWFQVPPADALNSDGIENEGKSAWSSLESVASDYEQVSSKLGLALWNESQAAEATLRSSATSQFRREGDFDAYFRYLVSSGYSVREHRGYWVAVNKEALYVYASLLQVQLIQMIVDSEEGFIEVAQLSDVQRRLLAGRFGSHPGMIESLEKGEGVIKAVPEVRVTVNHNGEQVSETRVVGMPTGRYEKRADPDSRRVPITPMSVPASWDVRLAEVFPSRNPSASYRAYAELTTLITEEIDEEVRQVIAEISESLIAKINENTDSSLASLRANQPLPDQWRNSLIQMTESWRGTIPDESIESRRMALERGSVASVDIVFFLSLDSLERSGTRVRAQGVSVPFHLPN